MEGSRTWYECIKIGQSEHKLHPIKYPNMIDSVELVTHNTSVPTEETHESSQEVLALLLPLLKFTPHLGTQSMHTLTEMNLLLLRRAEEQVTLIDTSETINFANYKLYQFLR